MTRGDLFDALLPTIGDDLVITSLGGNAQSWFWRRSHNNYVVHHAMGLTTAVGLGLALAQPTERVWVFEGDGGILMNLGMLAVLGRAQPANLAVVVVDNGMYESGGRLPTLTSSTLDLTAVATACGWPHAVGIDHITAVPKALETCGQELTLITARVEPGSDGAPLRMQYVENKLRFVDDVEAKLDIPIRHPA